MTTEAAGTDKSQASPDGAPAPGTSRNRQQRRTLALPGHICQCRPILTDAPSPLGINIHQQLLGLLQDKTPSPARLNASLRLLAKWRAALVSQTLRTQLGASIRQGPFVGMTYAIAAAEGSYPARLLGAYEASLFPVIEGIIARAYPLIIDVGCAEGYYAVGLARRMAGTTIWARDASDAAQALCRELAAQNGVADRVHVGGVLSHDDLAICSGQRTAVICDIEGAEGDLLDPGAAPGLLQADILVEVHEGTKPGLMNLMRTRFAASHDITRIDRVLDGSALPPLTEGWSDMDRLIALWEWREHPTPWLWLQSRNPARQA